MQELNHLLDQQLEHCSEGGEGSVVIPIKVEKMEILKAYAKALDINCNNCDYFKGCMIRQNFSVTIFCSQFYKTSK